MVQAEQGGSTSFAQPPDKLIIHATETFPKILQAFRKKYPEKDYGQYTPLYLRCDFIEASNQYLLSECEGVEPELFFRAQCGSEVMFAKSLINRI
ncbi:MAG: hypothetical protein FD167_4197 [bacterium]|nr:MAG: hypothetical protein FD167_4197 [bacterium]